jgi:hypothetical protein
LTTLIRHGGDAPCTTAECAQARRLGGTAAGTLLSWACARWRRSAPALRRAVHRSRVHTGTSAVHGSGGGAAGTGVLSLEARRTVIAEARSAPQPSAHRHVGGARQRGTRCWHGGALAVGETHGHGGDARCHTAECAQAHRLWRTTAEAPLSRTCSRWRRRAQVPRRRAVLHGRVHAGTSAVDDSGKPRSRTCSRCRRRARARRCRMPRRARDSRSRV